MTPDILLKLVVRPVVAYFDWPQPKEREAILVGIAIVESTLMWRRQMPTGPARSFWQIETPTAVDTLKRCKPVRDLWKELLLPDEIVPADVERSDLGACAIACGILRLTDGPLPPLTASHVAYKDYYRKAWRPGKPHDEKWPAAYAAAVQCCGVQVA